MLLPQMIVGLEGIVLSQETRNWTRNWFMSNFRLKKLDLD